MQVVKKAEKSMKKKDNKHIDSRISASRKASEFAVKVDITLEAIELASILLDDVTSMAIDEIIGVRDKGRKRTKYGY